MNTKKLRLFTLFILFCGLYSIASLSVNAQRANFRVTLNGFKVNQQSLEGLRVVDGMGDEVFFVNHVGTVDASGRLTPLIWGATFSSTIGADPPNRIRGGTASSSGGLVTGNTFPTDDPARRTGIITGSAIPPTILFEGEIAQRTNAALIIPTIWERDGASNLGLLGGYADAIERDQGAMSRNVAGMIATPRALALNSFLFSGGLLGIGGTVDLARDIPQDRPIGLHYRPEALIFNFTPQTLVLTFEAADYISRTSFGDGVGVISVRYTDAPAFMGDYTLYLQVEKLDGKPTEKQPNGKPTEKQPNGKFAVTDATFKPDNMKFSGKCPVTVGFTGYITTNGAGTVTYTFISSDGATSPVRTLDFAAAGTQAVATSWTLGGAGLTSYEGWQTLKILSPNELSSQQETGRFTINCEK